MSPVCENRHRRDPGCSGLESLGDELREQWGAAGSRLLATDLVRIVRQVKVATALTGLADC